jgi:3-deoxy-7-phosphoheptulonate synthase
VAVDAIKSAAHEHIFLSVTKQGHSAIFSTTGNPDCHVILRGGGGKTNFDNASVHHASQLLEKAGLDTRLMIDASHANASKDHRKQIAVCRDIAGQLRAGETRIIGVMIESNLVEGRQDLKDPTKLVYGQSITDACINWSDTEQCLKELSDANAARAAVRA